MTVFGGWRGVGSAFVVAAGCGVAVAVVSGGNLAEAMGAWLFPCIILAVLSAGGMATAGIARRGAGADRSDVVGHFDAAFVLFLNGMITIALVVVSAAVTPPVARPVGAAAMSTSLLMLGGLLAVGCAMASAARLAAALDTPHGSQQDLGS